MIANYQGIGDIDAMNILVTLDSNYINPLQVMIKSLFYNNPGDYFFDESGKAKAVD